jgi:hypothetical protein
MFNAVDAVVASFASGIGYVLWVLALTVIALAVIMYLLDIHVAVYRPKIPGRTTYFYSEIGNPSTSHLNIPKEGEE